MRRPLVPIALSFCAGIVLADLLQPPSLEWWFAAVAFLLLCILNILLRARRTLVFLALLLSVACAGGSYYRLRLETCENATVARVLSDRPKTAKLRGMVCSFPSLRRTRFATLRESQESPESTEYISFLLRVTEIYVGRKKQPASGILKVNLYEPSDSISYGQVIEVVGKIRKAPVARNPGQFNYRRFLKRKGVSGLLSVARHKQITIVGTSGNPFIRLVDGLRRAAVRAIRNNTSETAGGVLCCMLLGERHALPPQVEEDFRRTGTIHFLAVSGLHVMILAGSLWYGLILLGIRRKVIAVLVLIFLCGYTLIAGAGASILRASVIASVWCIGVLPEREGDNFNSLAAAALLILLLSPGQIFSPGFQFSFLAVIGIMRLYSPIMNLLQREPSPAEVAKMQTLGTPLTDIVVGYLKRNIAISAAACILTVPLAAYYFHIVTPLVLLFNLLVFPLIYLILSLGMICTGVALLLPSSGAVALFPAGVIASGFHALVRAGNDIPLSFLYVAAPSLGWLVCYYALIAFAASKVNFARKRIIAITAAFLLAIIPLYGRILTRPPDELKVTFLDVGHGNAVVMQLPSGRCVLYDVAGSPTFDIAANVIAPYLWREGVNFIDAVIISHPHFDHYGGLPSLAERFKIGEALVTSTFLRDESASPVAAKLRRAGTVVRQVAAGARLREGDFLLRILHPPPDPLQRFLSINDSSIVAEVTFRGRKMLLTGDAKHVALRMLRHRRGRTPCDLLLVPHHATRCKQPELLTETFTCRFAVISGREKEVSPDVLTTLMKSGAVVFRTGEVGAVFASIGESGIDVAGYLK